MRSLIFTLYFVILSCSTTPISIFERGKVAYNNHNYSLALKLWKETATNQKDSRADYFLGLMYSEGKGIKQNNLKSILRYIKAHKLGNNKAVNQLIKLTMFTNKVNTNNEINKTPLEFFKLKKLRYIGNFKHKTNDYVIILAPNNTFHRASKGMRLGKNFGEIQNFNDKEISIKEYLNTGLDSWVERRKKLTIE